jgi:thiol-disulfide isomerase/thioredoxin
MKTHFADLSKRSAKALAGIILCLLFLSDAIHASSAAPKPFISGSLKEEILAARQGKPLMLMLWSVDCSTCLKELGLLSETVRNHPNLDVVMISTDDAAVSDQAQALLEKHRLSNIESWIFAHANDPSLRFEIDSSWFGELPRTYFYTADHKRMALSGALQPKHFEAWLQTTQP